MILMVSTGPSGIVSHGRVRAWWKRPLPLGLSLTGSVQEVEETYSEEEEDLASARSMSPANRKQVR